MRRFCLVLLAVLALNAGVLLADESVVVATTYGKVSGFRAPTQSADGEKSTANVFLGVPFAQPPIGSLRFEKPEPPKPWMNVRDATKFSPACTPVSRAVMVPGENLYSEDCLYLNIMAPNWKSGDPQGFPVMVFIHGGGFEVGNARDFGYKFFVENYVPRDVLVITVQYRLAQFGFTTLEDEAFRGNYGLWDLVAGLKFVRESVARFGGDPNRVTIFGHSAGGAAVGHLAISPHAEGLFSNIIQMSGSPFAEWACSQRTEFSRPLVEELGCGGTDAGAVKVCMKSKSTDQLLDAVDKIGNYRHNAINFLIFVPYVDGDFHPHDLADSIRLAKSKYPTLIGVADAEGTEFTVCGALNILADLYVPPEEYAQFDEERFVQAITRLIANEETLGSAAAADDLRRRIVDFYIHNAQKHEPPTIYGEQSDRKDGHFYVRQYTKVVSDTMFVVPGLIDARAKAQAGWPVYFYRFGYLNVDSVYDKFKPVFNVNTHSGEYPYIFDIYFDTKRIPFSEDDRKFQENYLNTITTFAKTGSPTTSPAWPQLTGSGLDTLPHIELAPTLTVRDNVSMLTETLAFWRGIRADFNYPDIHSFPVEVVRDEL